MKYKYIQIISFFLAVIFLLNFISAFENNFTEDKKEETKYYQDVFYPSEEILAKQGMTLESYIQSLKATAPKNRNSSVDNIWGTSPLIGTVKIPVLLVKFSNSGSTISQSTINTKFNSPTITQSSISVKKYFNMQSYGALDVNFVVNDWIQLGNSSGYYDDNSQMNSLLITDTMTAFNSSVNFAEFDSDDNNRIDGIIIIYAGDKITGIPAQMKLYNNVTTNQYGGKYLGNTAIVSEKYNNNSDYIDVIAHEFTHVLGLPDLYANNPTDPNNGPMPNMSMMTSNHTNDSTCRKKPSNLDAWSRYFFGWTTPVILTTDSNKQISLRSANDFDDSVILRKNNMNPREYFIIENRYRTNNTAPYINLDYCMFNKLSPTTGGFAIYHVDENKIETDYPYNYVNWDRDNNYYNDTQYHPGVLYEKNKVSSLITFDTEPLDLYYFDSVVLGREKFDENFHKVLTNEIWDMTNRSYNGTLNPLIRFQAQSIANQETMTAKMLVGEETITPTITPDPTIVYNAPTPITITSQTPDSIIYYTLDGSIPTTSSIVYTDPFYINSNTTIKAIAKKTDFYVSDVLTANYTVNSTVATPTSNYESGNYIYNTQITLSTTTPQASIYYTIDGSNPDQNSTLYQSPIVIDHNFTLKAIAYRDGYLPSTVSTYNYTTNIPTNKILNITFLDAEIINKIEDRNNIYLLIPYNVDRRTLTPTITIDPGATITPQENGSPQDFTRPRNYTVTSPAGNKNYIISVFNDILVSPPIANPGRGTYDSPQTVTLVSGMPRFSTIKYTTDGRDPLNSPSQNYTTPITISQTTTLKARTFYSPLPVTSIGRAHSYNIDYQYNQIFQRLFKREYVSELMVEEYDILNNEKAVVQDIEIIE